MPVRAKECPNCGSKFDKERDLTPLDPHIISSQDFEELREGLKHRVGPDLTPLVEGIKEIQAKLSGPVSTAPAFHALHASVEDLVNCPTCKPLVEKISSAQSTHLPELDEIEDLVKDCPGCQKKWGDISNYVTTEARKGYVPETSLKGFIHQDTVREIIDQTAGKRSK